MILGNNIPAPPPPTPTQEIGADDDEEADEGPTLVTLTCPVKRPITDLNDGEPAPSSSNQLQSI